MINEILARVSKILTGQDAECWQEPRAARMSPSPIDHPTLASLLRYWQEKRGERAMPTRRDIDPLEMGSALLPHLVLCDLFERGTRVRFRLVGTVVVKRIGTDPTGKYLDQAIAGPYRDLLAGLHRLVYCERAPVYSESVFTWNGARRIELQHLLLPLAQDGPDPAIALAGLALRSTEPFPPSLGTLSATGQHRETRRSVLQVPAAHDWLPDAGRSVA